ncbi:AAA family ATPase [Candidatus Nanohaloarchaea archaeon]|nr:AAA family ATPase [Candidatus Nanohaloarchaea archaeon]
MTDPNKQQQKLIDNTDGIYLVDAGAGTGKTFTITRRYAEILDDGVEPGDILLATFTNNAADQMKERIIERTDVKASKIYDAPISTFHSFAKKILRNHGFDTPRILGLEEDITQSLNLMESEVREKQEFDSFMNLFIDENSQYHEFYQIIDDYSQILSLLKNLAAKGIVPEKEGWFGNSEKYIDGDFQEFKKIFKEVNKPRNSGNGKKQSELRSRLYSMKYKDFDEDAPSEEEVRGGYGTKQVRRDFGEKAFNEGREKLKEFVHNIYFSYLQYCLRKNYLNFNFLLAFSYVLLTEKKALRDKLSFKYLMIDEFQDTNEIQFKLTLLLADEPNICAVGDWKQSIYSFQYANVENIQRFQRRLEKYREELNEGQRRVDFRIENVEEIRLKKNYRSTQEILDLSEEALTLPATGYENLPQEEIRSKITSLESQKDEEGRIEKLLTEKEAENVLAKIQGRVQEGGREYGDIAVLTRTRNFGLELQKEAQNRGVPVAYEGGVELFKTNPAVMLLAWMRISNSNSDRGWAVVLENAGYTLDEAKEILDNENYPKDMEEFREELDTTSDIGQFAEKVFTRYEVSNGFTERIVEVLTDTFESSYMNLGQLIQFVEDNIEDGEIYEIDNSMQENVVKIQTIHAAKGLEYPVVFISDVNQSRFPSTNGNYIPIEYRDVIGLRTRKKYNEEKGFSFDNWRSEILFQTLSKGYDEERRLMYVGITRAEEELYITAEEGRKSTFFEKMPLEEEYYSEKPIEQEENTSDISFFDPELPEYEGSEATAVTSLLDLEEGDGREKGRDLHEFAEEKIQGDASSSTDYEENIEQFIEGLDGRKQCEVDIRLPADGGVIKGRIDLLLEKEEVIRIYDFKIGDKEPEKYQKQLSLYASAIEDAREKPVEAYIYCVSEDKVRSIEVMPVTDILDE